MIYFMKGILIGLLFGMPIGAVGAMTVQRTISHDFRAGLMTGLGSSVADCFYACIGAFGLTFVSDVLLKYQTFINTLGGTVVMIFGIRLFIARTRSDGSPKQVTGDMKMFLSSFVVGITNPAAIFTFLFAFSYFGIVGQTGWLDGVLLVAGVFIGTYIWWGALSVTVSVIKKKKRIQSISHINKIFGMILMLFGMAVFIKTFVV